jgi:cytochrome c oxidase subunit III
LPDALTAHAEAHGHGQAHAVHHPDLQHHFETLEQQHEASTLGMWIFIIQEVMFFGGLLAAYMLYRIWYPTAWSEGSAELDIVLGGLNTVVLIGSSLTMALAVRSAQTGKQKALINWLILTMLLGLTFLVVKGFEYHHKWELRHVPGLNFHLEAGQEPQIAIFLSLYFALTGLHALHMVIGFGILSAILWMAWRKRFSPEWYTPVEMSGLYWHFVDIVWIFLFPLLYLVDRAHQVH